MLKILVFIDSLGCGGAEKSLVSLLPFLAQREYKITLMVVNGGGLFERYVPENVDIKVFPYRPNKLQRLSYSLALRMPRNKRVHGAELYWRYVGRYLPELDEEYDVAIAYQQGFPTFYIAEKVRAKKKLCWINADLKAVGYLPSFNRKFYKAYKTVVCVSDIQKNEIIYPEYVANKEKLTVVYDILNENLIRQMAKETNVKHSDKLYITTVGRLVELKGYDWAIEAASILRDKEIDFEWHFVGGGATYMTELENLIAKHGLYKHIVFEGERVNPYPYIDAANIYVQTSKKEGFGMTVGEAKILCKPIVSTNFPVIHNQITDGVNGLIVEMTPQAIADGIMRLISDKQLRETIIANVKKEHNTTADTESVKVINLIES